MNYTKEHLINCLSGTNALKLSSAYRRAAVALILYKNNRQIYITFTKRSLELENHAGEISLPGGTLDVDDKTLIDCAIREVFEELNIQLEPKHFIGKLNEFHTITNFHVSPYVFFLDDVPNYKKNDGEVEEIIDVPLEHLLRLQAKAFKPLMYKGREWKSYSYRYNDHLIWGATGSIINSFLSVL